MQIKKGHILVKKNLQSGPDFDIKEIKKRHILVRKNLNRVLVRVLCTSSDNALYFN